MGVGFKDEDRLVDSSESLGLDMRGGREGVDIRWKGDLGTRTLRFQPHQVHEMIPFLVAVYSNTLQHPAQE